MHKYCLYFQLLLILFAVSCQKSVSDKVNSTVHVDSLRALSKRETARAKWQNDLDQFSGRTLEDSVSRSVPDLAESTFYSDLYTLDLGSIPKTAFLDIVNINSLVRIDVTNNKNQGNSSGEIGPDLMIFEDSLRSLGIKLLIVKERYIQFRSIGNNNVIVDRDSVSKIISTQGYIAFNTTKEPRLIKHLSAPNYAEIENYIKKEAVPLILLKDSALWNLPTVASKKDRFTDNEFWEFLLDYRSATDMLNSEILPFSPEFVEYNSGALWDDKRHPLSVLLEKEAKKLGFLLRNGMGDVYFGQSTQFIKDKLYRKTSSSMQDFLDLFLLSYEDGYWNEGLLVEPTEIARRLVLWYDFEVKYPAFVSVEHVKNEVKLLEGILIEGDDFEPSFDNDGKLLNIYKSSLEYVIENFTSPQFANDIKEFYQLLRVEDFKKTVVILEFLEKYEIKRDSLWSQPTDRVR